MPLRAVCHACPHLQQVHGELCDDAHASQAVRVNAVEEKHEPFVLLHVLIPSVVNLEAHLVLEHLVVGSFLLVWGVWMLVHRIREAPSFSPFS